MKIDGTIFLVFALRVWICPPFPVIGCPCWRCSSERSGRALWTPSQSLRNLVTSVDVGIGLTYASPILGQDGTVYIANMKGEIFAFQRAPLPAASGGDFWLSDPYTYTLVWRNASFPSTPILATPSIAVAAAGGGYRIVFAAGSQVVAVGAAAAAFAEAWRVDLCSLATVADRWTAQFGADVACAVHQLGRHVVLPIIPS